jgi:hypothetical protein
MAGFLAQVCIWLNIEISRYGEQRSPIVQPHRHRLKQLLPAVLALLAVLHGVPLAPPNLWRHCRSCSRPDDTGTRQFHLRAGVSEHIDSAPKLPPSG